MKKEKRILTAVSLLFAASVVFVFLNALDIKLGLCGGGCPDCLCDCNVANPGSVAPCGAVCPCGVCPAGTICDGAACVGCGASDCGAHFGVCGNSIACGGCIAPDTCIGGVCTPPCCTPDTCVSLGYNCGTHGDGCEGTIDCGTCTAPDVCVGGHCGCTPNCAGKICGGDGCGGSCGTCVDSGWNGCASSCVKSKSNNGVCTAGSCGTATANVSSGNYCSGGSEPAGKCSNTNHCFGNTYYDGYTCNGSGSCNVNYGDIGCCNHTKCGANQYCNSSHSCTALSACHERSAGDYGQSSVTAAEGRDCTGADTYCCSGSCENPPGNPSELGGACGSGDCAGGTWGCSGSDYECSTAGTGCDYCSVDYWYDSSCNKDGECPAGTENSCDKCNTCEDEGAFTNCIAAYERIQDTVDPNLCNGAGQVCHNGGCCDLNTCGHGADECGLGLDDNCGGTINCYCDKTDASCECSGGSCQSCAGTDASCWCDGVPGAGGECKDCHSLKVCKVDGAGNSCIGKGIVPPGEPADVPDDFEQSIMNITNWLAGFIVMLAILAMIYGGFIYLSSSGDQEKTAGGKKVVTYALLGLIIAGIAYAAVKVIVNLL